MFFTVITIFPEIIKEHVSYSILARALSKKIINISLVNPRDFTNSSHRSTDEAPFGGGAGMVMMAEPLVKAIESSQKRSSKREKIILMSPRGKTYSQKKAQEYASFDHIVLVSGRYEGVDERVLEYVDEEVSIGDYVLTGGEIPACVVIDSVTRLLTGVLEKEGATQEESFFCVDIDELIATVGRDEMIDQLCSYKSKKVTLLEYPHYTRPRSFREKKVPKVLLKGNHEEIRKWRLKKAYELTKKRRPDILLSVGSK